MARFKHRWKSHLDLESTWALILDAFRDSTESPVWPNELAEVRVLGRTVVEGAPVTASYKFGPLKMEAHYRIARLEPPRLLRYETSEEHPLRGFAEIRLKPGPNGTDCQWSGEYRPKGWASLAALFWFKLYYERRFFRKFIGNFRSLSTSFSEAA